MNRRGISVLVVVLALTFAIGLIALAVHGLWRNSSRGLFGIEEQRELVNLCHSSIAEALWSMETKVEQGQSMYVDWCTTPATVPDLTEDLPVTQSYLASPSFEGANLTYKVTGVTLTRIEGAPLAAGSSGKLGVIDFIVTAEANRLSPPHRAIIRMTRRHAFWFSDGLTPFTKGGRHIEILPTPVATFLEFP